MMPRTLAISMLALVTLLPVRVVAEQAVRPLRNPTPVFKDLPGVKAAAEPCRKF